jgi:uncharacterized protein
MSASKLTRVAVVTGGHSYDVPNFHRLFRSMGAGFDLYIQPMDDFASSPDHVRKAYDVVLFYIMLMDGPVDEGLAWYAGKPKSALEALGAPGQGLFVLHHALLAYPKSPLWSEIVGIPDRAFGFHPGQTLRVEVADRAHPITAGLNDFDMIDETYTMQEPGADSHLLLTANHPKSMRGIAWTRTFRSSRVFCLQSGHDNDTWRNASFVELVRRGLLWCGAAL